LFAALSLSLFALVFQYPDIYAARFSGGGGGGGHFSAGAAGDRGLSGNSGIGGIPSNVGLSDQRDHAGGGGLQLESPSSSHQLNSGCINSPGIFPSASNCPSPNVINPANAPNTAIVQPSDCNVPTSVHTNTPKNVVVHPSTVQCSNHNVSHPNNAPNTTVVHPNNCNVPNSVHHTNAPSTVVVHPNNCYSTGSSSSNSLTVNNVQTSSNGGGTSSSSSSNNNDTPVANVGPNQTVNPSNKVTLDGSKSHDPNGHSLSYYWLQLAGGPVVVLSNADTEKPTFSAPSVTSTTRITFQLIVNNGNADSSPSVVSVTVKP